MPKLYEEFIKGDVNLQEQKTRKKVHSVIGAIAFPAWIPYRLIRAAFGKCTRECGFLSINTSLRQRCLLSCKLKKKQAIIKALDELKPHCDKFSGSWRKNRCLKKIEKGKAKVEKQIHDIRKEILNRI
jgi:hypothetical protein